MMNKILKIPKQHLLIQKRNINLSKPYITSYISDKNKNIYENKNIKNILCSSPMFFTEYSKSTDLYESIVFGPGEFMEYFAQHFLEADMKEGLMVVVISFGIYLFAVEIFTTNWLLDQQKYAVDWKLGDKNRPNTGLINPLKKN
eukprot:GHVL01000507.1.p1 GENE.GHVL01000507.1~~GHVL01000507.1.p1  ORF type:complete len:156 (+),score=40.23 GHVL01000507.1:38-469(+)